MYTVLLYIHTHAHTHAHTHTHTHTHTHMHTHTHTQPMVLAPLLKCYGGMDERVFKLGVVFMHWVKVSVVITCTWLGNTNSSTTIESRFFLNYNFC